MKKMISVIIPVYNIAQYLPRCIESVINQTYDKLQIILIDDGSTDGSDNICDQYANKDGRITVVHKKNGGLVSARKAGLQIASGEYIGFVDGDDYIERNMFQQLCDLIEETNADFVNTGFKKNDGNEIYGADTFKTYLINNENIAYFYKHNIFDLFSEDCIYPSIWSKLFKKEVIIKSYMNLPDEQSYGEDLLCLCKSVYYSKKIVTLNNAYYHYTLRENSLSHDKGISGLTAEYGLYDQLTKLFSEFGLLSELKNDIENRFVISASQWISSFFNINIPQYKFPFIEKINGRKIVIYGAGKVGQDYYSQICKYQDCHITALADKNSGNINFDYCNVVSIDDILKLDYDLIIIAVLNKSVSDSIKKNLISVGIDENKIYWCKPMRVS